MSKVYKSNNKLILYLPSDFIEAMGIKTGDELEFLKYSDKSFLIARREDVAKLFIASASQKSETAPTAVAAASHIENARIAPAEMNVLKKLNNLLFNKRTKQSVQKILTEPEKAVLESLIKKKFVLPIKRNNEWIYSISKYIYPRLANNAGSAIAAPAQLTPKEAQADERRYPPPEYAGTQKVGENKIKALQNSLEANGYIVISNESDASEISKTMEESIRRGIVIGTRAFNRKFYIALKKFVVSNTPKIIGIMGSKKMPVDEISKQLNIDHDGILAILYLLAENGEVTEVKENIFKVVV
ncbi:MAG: AbrB/MazE/SpoVT family DNA-binding domain-containing protein [Candidatus Marsarchaeota archaeon]|nr:AbrB/MazE/SpoVT family DNA-binding domain-containing protein [Candidatus Marsarchaeota archaeon]MCL5105959.1 AbrB/MazE/SpoVT family DNA-binding domain-containing protein [Candidatus Marsarchaeota archaeon]